MIWRLSTVCMIIRMKGIIGKALAILFCCILIRLFVGELCYISSDSMNPTLQTGDWVWLDKMSYGALLPNRFAEIPLFNVFTWLSSLRDIDKKNNWNYHRTIGFGKPKVGDIIVFRDKQKDDRLLVKRVTHKKEGNELCSYYVMGDNRTNSIDSRFYGEIPDYLIVGKVRLVLFSTKSWKRFFKLVG